MNSYEDFLQAITELYDQNKIDYNNYKLLKNELKNIENIHSQQQKEYRNYFKMLEKKIKEVVVSGGGLTENQVQNIVSNYVSSHKSELKGERGERGLQGEKGEQGEKGSDGLTTQISVNGTTYTQSNGLITLPDYPTLSGSGSNSTPITISFNGNTYSPDSNGLITLPNVESGGTSIDTSNFITYTDSYVTDCNTHYVNGYIKTNNRTTNLPSCCDGNDSCWGVLFCILESTYYGTGTQIYYPSNGDYKGRVFVRSIKNLRYSSASMSDWFLLEVNATSYACVENPEEPGEMS